MKFEFIDNSLILENGLKFTFGMTKSEVAKLLKGYEYLYGKMYLIYPKKITHLDETYQYEELGNIKLRYLDNSLFLFHIPVEFNELFFKRVNLLNENYKDTVKQLKRGKCKCFYEKFLSFETYHLKDFPITLDIQDDKFLQVTISSVEYREAMEKEEGLYYAKMSRDKEDNVVIRYTRIKK